MASLKVNRYFRKVTLIIIFIIIEITNGNVLQSKAEAGVFPPSDLSSVNTSISLSEKIANFTGNGIQKIKSGVSSFINNVSNVFNKTQDYDNIILGAACTNDSNCVGVSDAKCDQGMCNCGPNFTVANSMPDRCLRIVKLGETCEEDVQCSRRTVGAICAGLHCVCSDNYTEDKGHCIPNMKLGSPCQLKDDCSQIPFASCSSEGVCSCPKPFISSTYNNACLINASPAGEPPCQEDKQCIATYGNNTACIEGICTCDRDYHPYNGKCRPDLKLGEFCSMNYDCIVSKFTEEIGQRECNNRTCLCRPGSQAASENLCVKAYGYQLQASLAWLLCIFFLPFLI